MATRINQVLRHRGNLMEGLRAWWKMPVGVGMTGVFLFSSYCVCKKLVYQSKFEEIDRRLVTGIVTGNKIKTFASGYELDYMLESPELSEALLRILTEPGLYSYYSHANGIEGLCKHPPLRPPTILYHHVGYKPFHLELAKTIGMRAQSDCNLLSVLFQKLFLKREDYSFYEIPDDVSLGLTFVLHTLKDRIKHAYCPGEPLIILDGVDYLAEWHPEGFFRLATMAQNYASTYMRIVLVSSDGHVMPLMDDISPKKQRPIEVTTNTKVATKYLVNLGVSQDQAKRILDETPSADGTPSAREKQRPIEVTTNTKAATKYLVNLGVSQDQAKRILDGTPSARVVDVLKCWEAKKYLEQHGVPENLAEKVVNFKLTEGRFIFLKLAVGLYKQHRGIGDATFFETYKKEVSLWYAYPTAVKIHLSDLNTEDIVKKIKAKGHPDGTK